MAVYGIEVRQRRLHQIVPLSHQYVKNPFGAGDGEESTLNWLDNSFNGRVN